MLVRCNVCGSQAAIQTVKEISPELRQLYCTCKNVQCGHTFVANLEFSHSISPSVLAIPDGLRDRIRKTPPAQQGELFAGFCPA